MKYLLILGLTILLINCNSVSDGSFDDLGDGFKFIKEYPQAIIYTTSTKHPSSGPNVIAPIITDYKVIAKRIFVISREELSIPTNNHGHCGDLKYWIIDKNKNYKYLQPIDSIEFYKEVNRLQIKMD